MRGLPNVNKATFDVNIADFTTSRSDINTLAAKGMIPANISVPENINLKGTFKGGISNFNTKINLRTTYGAVDLTAAMKNGSNKNNASYSANIRANNLRRLILHGNYIGVQGCCYLSKSKWPNL